MHTSTFLTRLIPRQVYKSMEKHFLMRLLSDLSSHRPPPSTCFLSLEPVVKAIGYLCRIYNGKGPGDNVLYMFSLTTLISQNLGRICLTLPKMLIFYLLPISKENYLRIHDKIKFCYITYNIYIKIIYL